MGECDRGEPPADEAAIIRQHDRSALPRMLAALLVLVLIAVAAFSAIAIQRPASTASVSGDPWMQGQPEARGFGEGTAGGPLASSLPYRRKTEPDVIRPI